jgi:IPT/TIG domain
MTDGPVKEPPQGTPSRRALGAMESAVRRAREAAGPSSPLPPAKPFAPPPSSEPPSWSPPPPADEPDADAGGYRAPLAERWLIVSVAVTATLVVIGAIALALSSRGGGPQQAAPPTSSATSTGHAGTPAPGRSTGSGAAQPSGSSPPATSTTSTTAPPANAGGPPQISSLSPSSGAAGQGIQVAGANFLSSDGQIVATFNGQVAPTSCPAQNVCTVTVPPMTSPGSAQVTITTAAGTSNAVSFTYS